jgi:hypothetical protein
MGQIELLEKRISDDFEQIIKLKKDIQICNKTIFKLKKARPDYNLIYEGEEMR